MSETPDVHVPGQTPTPATGYTPPEASFRTEGDYIPEHAGTPEHGIPAEQVYGDKPPSAISADLFQQMIDQAVKRATGDLQRELDDMREQLKAKPGTAIGTADHIIPQHAAGIGAAVHETWSYLDQTLASLGKHPLQLAELAEAV